MASEAIAAAGTGSRGMFLKDILTGYGGPSINLVGDVFEKCVKTALIDRVAEGTKMVFDLAAARAEDDDAIQGYLVWESYPHHYKNSTMKIPIVSVGSTEDAPFQVQEGCIQYCDEMCRQIPRTILTLISNHGIRELLYQTKGEFLPKLIVSHISPLW